METAAAGTVRTLAMVVVGGMHSLTGAVVGSLVATDARHGLIALERGVDVSGGTLSPPGGAHEIVLAVILPPTVTFRPHGIVGEAEAPLVHIRSADDG